MSAPRVSSGVDRLQVFPALVKSPRSSPRNVDLVRLFHHRADDLYGGHREHNQDREEDEAAEDGGGHASV